MILLSEGLHCSSRPEALRTWSGPAAPRVTYETEVGLADLRRAWAPLDLENHAEKLARADLDLQFVFATRDTVVLPELSRQLVRKLKIAGAASGILELNCGHYSLSLLPICHPVRIERYAIVVPQSAISALTSLLILSCLHLQAHPNPLGKFPAELCCVLHLLIGSDCCDGSPIEHGRWDTANLSGLSNRPTSMRN